MPAMMRVWVANGFVTRIDEYLDPDEQKALEKAGKLLEKTGTVIGGVLCADDDVSKLIFTVAKSKSGAWVGVCACRVES